jgi:hypothetical protein
LRTAPGKHSFKSRAAVSGRHHQAFVAEVVWNVSSANKLPLTSTG